MYCEFYVKITLYGFFVIIFNLYFFCLIEPRTIRLDIDYVNVIFDNLHFNIFNLFMLN